LIAGLAALRRPGAPLALWEPVVDGGAFFRAAFRARRMSAVAGGTPGAAVSGLEELEARGVVDMMGYPIYRALYDSGVACSLTAVATASARPVLLVQVSRRETLKPEFVTLAHALRQSGSSVEEVMVKREEAWSFVGSPVQSTRELIDATLAWLGTVLAR
jgi:hypothetical protein